VSVLFEFRNEEPELTAHVAFGLHPGFGAASFESFRLQMPPSCYRRYFLAPAIVSLAKCGTSIFPVGKCRFPEMNLPGSCILEFVDVPAREFCYVDPPSGCWVIVDLNGVPLSNSVVR